MRATQKAVFAAAFVLSQSFQLVAGHGHDEATDMDMTMGKPEASPAQPSTDDLISYFANGSHTGSMIAHVSLMVLAWVFILPVGVVLSISRSRLALPIQFLFTIANALGIFFGIIFNARTPDLYPNNAHHKMGWVATWIMTAQVVMGLLFAYSGRGNKVPGTADERTAFLPLATDTVAQVDAGFQHESNYRWSGDSGQGTEPPSPLLDEPNMTEDQRRDLYDRLSKPEPEDDSSSEDDGYVGRHYLRNSRIDKFLTNRVPKLLSKRLIGALSVAYNLIDRTILILGFAVIATGGIAYAGIMRGDAVFNGLAHFIKGGIFFWYGLLTLGRWMGSFADLGWAWNVKPSRAEVGKWKARIPSGEFVESFVIFLYGFTNVWLEHLAAWGGEWVAQDLEHVSISIMFLGGGLCGMLVDSSKVRDLLNSSVSNLPEAKNPTAEDINVRLQPKIYKTPMNPMPGLVILLLGMMMSSHHQASMLSSMVHKQWGSLLVGFSLARAITYVILYIAPPTSIFPSRPPSELVSAFCLISGGLIFMASNKDIVDSMEFYDLNAMFVFTVGMGFTAFLMAWEVAVLAIKGWAVRRNMPYLAAVGYQA